MKSYSDVAYMCFNKISFDIRYIVKCFRQKLQSLMRSVFFVVFQFLYDKPAIFRKLIKVKLYFM